MAFLEI